MDKNNRMGTMDKAKEKVSKLMENPWIRHAAVLTAMLISAALAVKIVEVGALIIALL